MIKLFRNIRQRMLSENKFSKYLLYAIGEIVLVVIGILIALSINNWNENQQSKQQELVTLENIMQDLKDDEIGLNTIIERRTSKAVSAEIMESYYNGVTINTLSDYYYHWTNVLYWDYHSHRNIAFKELINSGNVSIIKNLKIRKSLLNINTAYEDFFAVRDHMYDDYILYLYTPYSGIIDYEDGIKVWLNRNVPIELSETDVAVALKNKTIKNGFTLASFNNNDLKEKLMEILNTVELTIVLINEEIKH